ncbi:sugar-binding transcriptional regulator [Bacillus sp. FSL K6-3431]|uniref:sugar-binding transcriptional regulator n=1 Tax=Bacillus sp. FSL K6-3431 TaxID=2921500 RepID=UPI0030F8143E
MDNERLRLIVKVSQQYFMEGLNQQEIASKYGISRSQVSRMISSAKSEGIVEIKIRNPLSDESALEEELIKCFKLRDAIVVNVPAMEEVMTDVLIAKAASTVFENVIKSGDTVGVMAGKSITSLAREVKDPQKKNLYYVPLVGGWGSEGLNWHANTNASIIAKSTKGSYSILHAPAVVTSAGTKDTLLREPEIAELLNRYRQLDVALIGVGEISKEATHVKSTNMKEEEIEALKREGVVASIGTIFLDKNGTQLSTAFSDRMIGISGNDLKMVPIVIAVASGEGKITSIKATLSGGWIDILVTDTKTAKALLEDVQKVTK